MSTERDEAPNPYQAPQTTSSAPVPTSESQLASRVNRLGAAIVDSIIAMVVTIPLIFFTGYFQRTMQNNVTIGETLVYTIIGFVLFLGIHGYFLATRGQTVGKIAAKIRIVDYRTSELLPIGKLIGLRYLPLWIVNLFPFGNFLALINVLFIFGSERRCIHDYIAGTKVVNVSP